MEDQDTNTKNPPARDSVIESTLDPVILESESRIAFPILSEVQIDRIRGIARSRELSDSEVLWQVGDRAAAFYIVLHGAVAISQPLPGGETRLVVKHGPGGFTGDVDLLSTKAAVVSGIASGPTMVLEVHPDSLKKLVVSDPDISDLLLAAFIARRRLLLAQNHGDITLVGSRYSPEIYALREFLERNSRPFNWIDIETDPAADQIVNRFGLGIEETPAVVTAEGVICRNPSVERLAEELGLSDIGVGEIYDMAVVGAGPAGLAAAVYGGSEGLETIVLDAHAPGGQAGTSSKIENYLGFPMGISGAELAQNALLQAEKFGVRFATPQRASKLVRDGSIYRIELVGRGEVKARTVVAASGVRYRRLPAENAAQFEGRGIYFAATRMEAGLCSREDIAIVGGGNSAGQAAVFLAGVARQVHILIRSGDLDHSMSRYLINRIDALPNVQLHPYTEISRFEGQNRLQGIEVRNNQSGLTTALPVTHVFVFIGAVANTAWLRGAVHLDKNGFVYTDDALPRNHLEVSHWPDGGKPAAFETNLPGVFAIGDVRCGSTKRVASAVGEGSVVVQFVHRRVAHLDTVE